MAIRAFLLCGDEKAVQAVTQILDELEVSFEHSSEPAFSLKRLATQRFELLVVDCDNAQNATQVFNSARASNLNKTSIAIAIVEGKAGVPNAFRLGASLVLTKPVSLEQSRNTLRTGIGMTRKDAPEVRAAAPTVPATPLVAVPPALLPTAPVPVAPPAPVRPMPAALLTPVAAGASLASEAAPKVLIPVAPVAEQQVVVPRPAVSVPAVAQDLKSASSTAAESKSPASMGTPASRKTVAAAASGSAGKSSFDSMFTAPIGAEDEISAHSAKPASEGEPKATGIKLSVVDPLAEEDSLDPGDDHGVPSFGGMDKQPFAGFEKAKRSSGRGALIAAALILVAAAGAYIAWATQPAFRRFVSWEYLNLMSRLAVVHGQDPTPVAVQPATPAPVQAAQRPVTATNTAPADSTATAPNQNAFATPAETGAAAAPSNPPATSTQSMPAPADNGAQKTATVLPAKQDTTPNHSGANPSLVAASASLPAPDAVKPPSTDLLEVPEDYADDQVIHRVHPVYPKQAKARKLQGPVVLQAIISKRGKVDSLQLISGDPLLAQAAADAVKQWRYKPYSHNGDPTDFQTRITVDFKLP